MRVEFERQVLRLFDEMLDHDPAARATWLAEAAGGDTALMDAVRAMTQADESASFLPTIPPDPLLPADAPPPARIGNYRITGELGRGGMGVVYLAERDDGMFEHRVAIKLLRRTLFSEAALAQFAVERRILARLRHPHIAQILDGGVTEDGASYIIMEQIRGTPITDYAATRSLAIGDRLALFLEAMGAIEHAHRNLIVHADIKPSNVVVEDGFGVKLLDFGVARLIDGSERQRPGGYTPGYASPARLREAPSTPADDIFAAGVLLRALMTDCPGVDDDLIAVTDKAAAHDADTRYGAISEFRADIDRWRSHRGVTARPPSGARTITLFTRRHRLGVMFGSLAVFLVLATLAITTISWLHAERARGVAESRFDETRAMANYMLTQVDPQLGRVPGTLALRRNLISRSRLYLQRLEADRVESPALELEIAAGYLRLARVYGLDVAGGLGNLAAARDSLEHARALIRSVAAQQPGALALLPIEAQLHLIDASEVFVAPDDSTMDKSLDDLRTAQSLLATYLKHRPSDIDAQLGLWRAQVMTGRIYAYRGQDSFSRKIVLENLWKSKFHVETQAQQADRDFILNGSYLMLAESYEKSSPRTALHYYSALVDNVAQMRRESRSDLQNDFIQATAMAGVGEMSGVLGDFPTEIERFQASISAMQRLLDFGANHEIAAFEAYVELQLAEAYSRRGAFSRARALSDRAIAWFREDLVKSRAPGAIERMLAVALTARSDLERRADNQARLCPADKEAVAAWEVVVRHKAVMPIDLVSNGPVQRARTALGRECHARATTSPAAAGSSAS